MPTRSISPKLPSVISTDENCVLHYSGRDVATYFVMKWKSLQRLINNHGPSLEKIGPIRRFQIANCTHEMRSKTGPKPTDLALLPGHVRFLRGLVRKRLENSHLIRDMAEHEAKLERRFQLDHNKALKQTHQAKLRQDQHRALTDAIRDHYLPLVESQNADSSYLNPDSRHNAFMSFARIPALKDRGTPRAIAISNLVESDCVFYLERGAAIGADYKALYRLCANDAQRLVDRLSSPTRRQVRPTIGAVIGHNYV